MNPKIALEVGELVLEGLEVRHRERIEPAMRRELERLFFLLGTRPWMRGRETLALPDTSIDVPPHCRAEDIGVRIARDLFSRLNTPIPPSEDPGGRR